MMLTIDEAEREFVAEAQQKVEDHLDGYGDLMYQKCRIAKATMFGSSLHSWVRKLRHLQAPKMAVSFRAIQGATSLRYWRSNAVISQRPLVPDSDEGQRRQERLNDII